MRFLNVCPGCGNRFGAEALAFLEEKNHTCEECGVPIVPRFDRLYFAYVSVFLVPLALILIEVALEKGGLYQWIAIHAQFDVRWLAYIVYLLGLALLACRVRWYKLGN